MRPYGYDTSGNVIEKESRELHDAKRRLLEEKESMRSVIADLREREVVTSSGKLWSQNSLRRLLVNPRLAGLRMERGKLVKAPWDPIFTLQEHQDLVALLDDPSRKQGPGSKDPKYLLSGGYLACGRPLDDTPDSGGAELCLKTLYIQPSSSGTRGYVCRKASPSYGCGRLRIAAGPLEEEVTARVLARLAAPKVRERLEKAVAVAAGGKESVEDAITAIRGRVTDAAGEYARRGISLQTLRTVQEEAEREIKQLNEQLEQARRLQELPATTVDGLAQWWVDATLEQRRDLLGLVLRRVIVKPATRRGSGAFDLDRLEFVWK